MNVSATIVRILHILIIALYCVAPFTNSDPLLVLHLFTGPFLWFHWITNNDTCSLTLLEMKLRGIEECEESFFWSVVSPLYKPQCDDLGRQFIWIASIALWLVTVSKVLKNPSMVTDMFADMRRLVTGGGVTQEITSEAAKIP
jgi:hypothetical protein